MLDDFLIRALLAGTGIALVAGPMGCLVVWRKMAYFGDTLAHSALLGVALALLLQVNLVVGVFVLCVAISLVLLWLQRKQTLPTDALLGILSHGALALGLVVIASMSWVRVDLIGLLFGDILSVSKIEVMVIWGGAIFCLLVLTLVWRSLFAASVDPELAQAENLNPAGSNLIFTLLLAVVIAVCMRLVGVILVTALLIIPAATARRFCSSPEAMAFAAIVIGAASVWMGLMGSLQWDTPSGPSIVVAALALFLVSLLPFLNRKGHARLVQHGPSGEENG